MRVLFAIGSMGGGGAERQTLHYLRHLDRSRFTPLLYLHVNRGKLRSQVPADVPVLAFCDRQTAPRFNYPGRIQRQQVTDLALVLDEQQIDVLCAITLQLTLIAGSSTKRRPTPWLAIEMADPRLSFEDQVGRFGWLKKHLLWHAYRRADRALAVSDGVREGMIQRYGLPAHHIVTLRNFIDIERVDRQASEAGPQLDLDRFHIVSVGRLHEQKGHCYLLEAIRELVHQRNLQQLHVHLVGDGPLEHQLRETVNRVGLRDHVTFEGFLENPFSFIRRCQLFCFPSLYEGLPLALLEAMACRVPVVATTCLSGPSEVLADGRFGRLVPPADPAALVEAIQEVVDDYANCQQLAQAARQHVEEHYSVHIGMERLQKLLSEIAR